MLGLKKASNQEATRYATSADFCRIFQQDMDRLYVLSFLLTGDQEMAEKCFVRGLDDSGKGNPVFKEWAQAWARRTIIQNAIQMIRPRPTDGMRTNSGSNAEAPTKMAEMAAIISLPNFDRFAYVLSVLEHYPLQECALLLNCSRGDVVTARMRALQQVVKEAQNASTVCAPQTSRAGIRSGYVPQFAAIA